MIFDYKNKYKNSAFFDDNINVNVLIEIELHF